jgi:hypothetical protein
MSEVFKLCACISFILACVGDFCIIEEMDIFPPWMYVVMAFYMCVVWIAERVFPLLKDIVDLFDKG